jgi:hypothetical protein
MKMEIRRLGVIFPIFITEMISFDLGDHIGEQF